MRHNEFNRTAESYNLLRGFGSQCVNERDQCAKTVIKTVDSWFMGIGSPCWDNSMDSSSSSHDSSLHYLIEQLLPDILRMSLTAPYEDVRLNCHNLLHSIHRRSFLIPRPKFYNCSRFLPSPEIEDLEEREEKQLLQNLLNETFEDWGRIENYVSVMGHHPAYLEQYTRVYNYLLRGDGSLPYVDRYYVAIMAAAQMHSQELIHRFITEFLSAGGDPVWLTGLEKAPKRLHAIAVLGQYLCHQPWAIETKNISQLIHGPSGSFHISLSQLMHAVVIITHVSSLACFLFSCGVAPEIDHPGAVIWDHCAPASLVRLPSNHEQRKSPAGSICPHHNRGSQQQQQQNSATSSNNPSDLEHSGNHNNHDSVATSSSLVSQRLNSISDPEDTDDIRSDESRDCPVEILVERLKEAQEDDDELAEVDIVEMFRSVEKENEQIMKNPSHPLSVNPVIERFVADSSFGYLNFNSFLFPVLRSQDYSWSDEACSLADRVYPDIGSILERKFDCSYELTYNTMGDNTNIDTSLFRMSVWIYVHSLYGIRHDDFNYSQLDNLITKPLKCYVKKSVTKPCTVTHGDFWRYMPEFKLSEKVHVALMVADARQQACLLHILRAIKSINGLQR